MFRGRFAPAGGINCALVLPAAEKEATMGEHEIL